MLARHVEDGVQGAAVLAPRVGQVDVARRRDREAAEHGVAVGPAAAHLDVRKERPVRHARAPLRTVRLAVAPRAPGPVVDLLEQHEVGRVVPEHGDDALGPVAPIDPADPLVDVVGQQLRRTAGPVSSPRGAALSRPS